MTRERRLLIWYLLLGPVLLVVAVSGNEFYGRWKVQRELALCRDAGMELDPAKLTPPLVPDDQNAVPLLLDAFEQLQSSPVVASSVVHQDLLDLLRNKDCPLVDKVLPEARRVLDLYDPFLLRVDEALRRAHCRYEPISLVDAGAPRFTLAREVAKWRCYGVYYACWTEGPDAAYRRLPDVFRARRALGSERLFIGALVNAGLLSMAEDTLKDLVQDRAPPSAQAARELLAVIPTHEENAADWREAISGEATCFLLRYWNATHPGWFRLTRLFDREHKAFALGVYRLTFDRIDRPLTEANAAGWPEGRWYHVSHSPGSSAYGIAPSWSPDEHSATAAILLAAAIQSIAKTDLVRLTLRIELHRHEHGEYPQSLDKLAMPEGEVLPRDPFDGQPYRYVRLTDGYKLWSVGRNCVDDGGLPNDDDPDQGDIVIWVGPEGRAAREEHWDSEEEKRDALQEREADAQQILDDLEDAWKQFENPKK